MISYIHALKRFNTGVELIWSQKFLHQMYLYYFCKYGSFGPFSFKLAKCFLSLTWGEKNTRTHKHSNFKFFQAVFECSREH